MNRRTLQQLLLSTLIVGATLLSGCGKEAAKAVGPPPPAEVGVLTIQPQRVALSIELSGRTAPCQVAEVRPQVSGIIQQRFFTEGAEVKAGQTLYQVDPATYQSAYANAKAVQAKAEANLLPARLKVERYRELIAINAISRQDYDDAEASVKQFEAEVAAAEAALASARINLQYTSIAAPISGHIGRSDVTPGALVTANQAAALATIQQLDPIYVDVTRSSSELLQLKRQLAAKTLLTDATGNARVKLLFEDGTAYPQPGRLKFSEVSVDPSTGSVTLRMLFPNPDQLLLPGMFVRAVLEEGVKEQAILVPQRGVTRTPTGAATVMLVGADEKVEPRVITVIRTVGDSWLISDGLKTGDRVILEGLQKARPGTVVKAVPFGAPAAKMEPPKK